MKLILVEWVDSHGDHKWKRLEDAEDQCGVLNCRTIGWLIAEKNGYMSFASTLSGEDDDSIYTYAANEMRIPIVSITRMVVLSESGKKYRTDPGGGSK